MSAVTATPGFRTPMSPPTVAGSAPGSSPNATASLRARSIPIAHCVLRNYRAGPGVFEGRAVKSEAQDTRSDLNSDPTTRKSMRRPSPAAVPSTNAAGQAKLSAVNVISSGLFHPLGSQGTGGSCRNLLSGRFQRQVVGRWIVGAPTGGQTTSRAPTGGQDNLPGTPPGAE